MATLGLKEMGKFLWEGREKGGKRREKGRARINNNKICCVMITLALIGAWHNPSIGCPP